MDEGDEFDTADRGLKRTRAVHVARFRYGSLVQRQGKPARVRVGKSSNLFCRFTDRNDQSVRDSIEPIRTCIIARARLAAFTVLHYKSSMDSAKSESTGCHLDKSIGTEVEQTV